MFIASYLLRNIVCLKKTKFSVFAFFAEKPWEFLNGLIDPAPGK
jgi:hypothetical protein